MSKSKARFLGELLSSDGKVVKSKSEASTIVVGDLPTIPNSKLQNSSVTIAGEGLSLGASLTLDTGDVTEHTNYKYYTDGRVDARITNAGSGNWNTAYGWGNHASAGYITSDTNTHTHLDTTDNRTISASEFAAGDLHFGFTSWANNNTSPYADFIHMRSYADSSGGNENLLMFKKSGKGIRLWQSSFGSSSAYSSYVDIWDTGTLTTTNKANYDTAYGWGNHASAGYVTSSGNTIIGTDTDLSFAGANVLASIALTDGVITSYANRVLTLANLGYTGETNATADQSAAEIRAAVEAASDSNVFTDADHTKLGGIAASANNYVLPSGIATESYVNSEITTLIGGAPSTLNDLNELAAAINDDANYNTTLTTALATKLPLAGGTVTGNLTVNNNLYIGDGNDGYFYNDQNGRTAFRNGDFYIQDTVTNYYNYATNQYHGNSSGDNHYFRGNALSGNNWGITAAGGLTVATGAVSGKFAVKTSSVHNSYDFYVDGTAYINGATTLDADTNISSGVLKVAGTTVIDSGRNITMGASLTVAADGGSNYTSNHIRFMSHNTARGAGHFMMDDAGANTWYTGTAYADAFNNWGVHYKAANEDEETAHTQRRVLTVGKTGNLTAAGVISATGGNSGNWNTAYSWGNHASAGYGDITGVTAGTGMTGGGTSGAVTLNVIGGTGITANANNITVDSTVLTTSTYGTTLTPVYAPVKKGTATLTNAYQTVCTVNGNSLGSSVRMTIAGTGPSTVISTILDIVCNHSLDILVTSQTSSYTTLTVKIVSNNNEDFAVQLKTNSTNNLPVNMEVFALNSETVAFTSTNPFTGATLEHECKNGGFASSSSGGATHEFYSNGTKLIAANDNQALHDTDALSISGSTITLRKGDNTTETIAIPAQGDITGVTAGTGLTGGGTSGTPTLNVIGGSGITANANDITVDSTVLRTTGAQEMNGALTIDVDNQAGGALRIEANQTNPDQDFYFAQEIYSTLSGTTATTSDREQGGIFMDLNSTATGGDTSNEHRVYGAYLDVDSTGDADLVYGVYSNVTATPTTGQTTSVFGGYFHAEDNGGAGSTSNVYGIQSVALSDNATSDINAMYAGHFRAFNVADSGSIGASTAVYGEIEIASGSADIYGNSYVFRAEYDNNGTVAQTNTTYLYYGNYAGVRPTTAYGVYIQDDIPNVFIGSVRSGVGTTSVAGYGFNGDVNTGMYSPANHELGFTTNGTQRLKLSSTGADITGNIAVTGTVDGVDIAARNGVLTTTTNTANAALPKAGGTLTGELNVSRNGGMTGSSAPQYSNANIELQTSSNHAPAISFHRDGYSATTLYEYDGQLYTNPWTTRSQTGLLMAQGNLLAGMISVDGSGSGLDADLLDGKHLNQIAYYQSGSDFANGTLVTTNIASSAASGDSFVIEITGKAYGASRPHSIIAEGYLYNSTIINTNGTNISGSNFTYIKVMNNSGYLSFWWPRHGYWNSYNVHVRSSSAGTSNYNRVTAIANSVDPSGATKKIQINLATSWNSANNGSGSGLDADLLDGQQGSYYLPTTGKAADSNLLDGIDSSQFLRSDTADTIGATLTMGTQKALVASNYGRGVYGLYNASKYQHVWSMGTSYNLADDGTSSGSGGNLYGLAWTYNPNHTYSGSNAQARAGLGHQLLLMSNGTAYSALGTGIWTSGTITSNNQGTLWGSSNDGAGSGLDADLLDGQQASYYRPVTQATTLTGAVTGSGTTSITTSNPYQNSVTFSTNGPDSTMEYQQLSGVSDTKISPSADWYNSIRLGHGDPYSYYSNTIAVRMTGGSEGTIYTQSILNSNANGWKKHWNDSNDGSGSGLDADLLDGQHGSYYLPITGKAADSNLFDGIDSNRFIYGTNTSKVYRWNGDWNTMFTTVNTGFIDNSSGTNGNPDGFTHHHGFQVRHDNMSNAWGFQFMGSYHPSYQSLYHRNVNAGTWSAWKEIWDSSNDGSGSGLDADLLDGQHGSYYYSSANPPPTYSKYLRSDTDDSFTGNNLLFPTLSLNIANNNGAGSGNTYFRGSSSHFVFGLTSGNTLYMNYGNSAGAFRTEGTITHNSLLVGTKPWGNSNDGSGSGLDADLLDGEQGSNYARQGNVGYQQASDLFTFPSYNDGNSTSGDQASLQIYNGNTGEDAFLQFHVSGDYAGFFGLDGATNDLFWGGWSVGNNKHKIWHAGNDGSGSGLDADYVDGVQASSFIRSDAADTFSGTLTMATQVALAPSNYGRGLFGLYSSYRYQHVWAMGSAYKTSDDGQSYGNMYGLTYTHTNVGTGTNQSISGLSHQLQHRHNGTLTAAIGSGIWTSGNVTAYSDIAVKTNLVRIPNALEKVCSINGYTYERTDYVKDLEDPEAPDILRQAGVVAQEIEKVLPEVVSGNDGNKAVAYGNIVALLIESIKELKDEVDELKKQLREK